MNNLDHYPKVSVIVPTLNAPEFIRQCLASLVQQTYPDDRYEIIVVDNGSSNHTIELIKGFKVKLLSQTKLKSPYPSRNLGIREAKGDIIALVDANCVPAPNWLEEGVKSLVNQKVDLVGGKVVFTFSARKTGAEIYDSLHNVQMEENIKERGVAKTASLFIYRYVFDHVGLFPEDIRSGGDVIWTSRVVAAKYQLKYSENSIIYKKARTLHPLLQKQIRVGKGQPYIWLQSGEKHSTIWARIIITYCKSLLFLAPNIVKLYYRFRKKNLSRRYLIQTFFAGWMCIIATNTGRVLGLMGTDVTTKSKT